MDEQERRERLAALRWQVEAGADEVLAAAPVDSLSAPAAAVVAHSPQPCQPAVSQRRRPQLHRSRRLLRGGADPHFDKDASLCTVKAPDVALAAETAAAAAPDLPAARRPDRV